jgi:hypothetical protein
MSPIARALLLATCVLVSAPASAQWSGQDVAPPTRVDWKLVAGPMRGPHTRLVALVAEPKAGWHTYWTPKGEPNVPTRVTWRVDGAKVGEGRWPTPRRFEASGLANYGYDRPYAVIFPVTLSGDASAGRTISAGLDYYVCSDSVCAAEKADVSGAIGADVRHDAVEWSRYEAAQPRGTIPGASWWSADGRSGLSFRVPQGASGPIAFLPYLEGAFLRAGAQTTSMRDGVVTIRGEAGRGSLASGLVSIGGRSWTIEPKRIDPPAGPPEAESAPPPVATTSVSEPVETASTAGAAAPAREAAHPVPADVERAPRLPTWFLMLVGLLAVATLAAGLSRRSRAE